MSYQPIAGDVVLDVRAHGSGAVGHVVAVERSAGRVRLEHDHEIWGAPFADLRLMIRPDGGRITIAPCKVADFGGVERAACFRCAEELEDAQGRARDLAGERGAR